MTLYRGTEILKRVLFVSIVAGLLPVTGNTVATVQATSEDYHIGYDTGCSDSSLNGDQRQLQTSAENSEQFNLGYEHGYLECSNNYDSGSNYETNGPSQRQGINWYEICTNPIVDTVITEPCDTLVKNDGYELTSEGERVLWCIVGGGILTLAGVPPESLTILSSSAAATGICG